MVLLATTLAVAVMPAFADGLLVPPPPPYALPAPQPLYGIPLQGAPSQSCIETAIQLAYQTGSRHVGNAAARACEVYAPVHLPRPGMYYGPPPLGGYPPPR